MAALLETLARRANAAGWQGGICLLAQQTLRQGPCQIQFAQMSLALQQLRMTQAAGLKGRYGPCKQRLLPGAEAHAAIHRANAAKTCRTTSSCGCEASINTIRSGSRSARCR